jgi:hypothetical protein
LEFVGLKFSIAYLIVKIIEGKPPLFPFGVGGKGGGLKRNTDAAPLRSVIGSEADVFLEITGSGRILKDGVVIELCPMDILGQRVGCHE